MTRVDHWADVRDRSLALKDKKAVTTKAKIERDCSKVETNITIEDLRANLEGNKPLLARDIIQAVADHYGIALKELLGLSQTSYIAKARQHTMYLIRLYTMLSTPEIGRILGRDYTTVIHGIKAHAARQGLPVPERQKKDV